MQGAQLWVLGLEDAEERVFPVLACHMDRHGVRLVDRHHVLRHLQQLNGQRDGVMMDACMDLWLVAA